MLKCPEHIQIDTFATINLKKKFFLNKKFV